MAKNEKPVNEPIIDEVVKPKKKVQTAEGWKRNHMAGHKMVIPKVTKNKAA